MKRSRVPSEPPIDYGCTWERWRQLCDGTSARARPRREYVRIACRYCDHSYEFDSVPPDLNKNGTRTRALIGKYQTLMGTHVWNKHGLLGKPHRGIVSLMAEW